MFTFSRLAKSSLLVLLTATLTTAAYAGGGHSGSNGSTGSRAPVHSDARVVVGHGNQTLSKPAVAPHGFGVHPLWTKVIHQPVAPQGQAK